MEQDAETLRRLSPLLDQALDLDEAEREAWLAGLTGEAAELVPLLRSLLASDDARETADILRRRPNLASLGLPDGAAEFNAGDTIGPYRLLSELGRGGMGDVWLAERTDGGLKRRVALKLPVLGVVRRRVLMQRFERERDILGALAHPNIARLYDAGLSDDGQPYLALEYVQGQPITQYAHEQGLDTLARIRLLRQVMEAVQYAHANLVIHRDIKPGNVLVTADGKALLLDFGIAKLLEGEAVQAHETGLTQVGGKMLTMHYAAPEQILGNPISIATDVWALGVLLYELVSEQRPFDGDRRTLEHEVLEADPVRPSRRQCGSIRALPRGLATDLDTIVLKALKKLPGERYATVSAFGEDLNRWQRGEAVLAQRDSAGYRARKFAGRHRWAVAVASMALLALLGFTVSLDAQVRKVTSERDRADRLAQFMTDTFSVADPNDERSGKVTARELLDTAAQNLESGLTDDPDMRARLARTMARAYTGVGALTQSEAFLRKEYDRARSSLGDDHPATLALGSELVWLLYIRFKIDAAEPLGRDILARQRIALGPDDPATATTESHLAAVLAYQGKYDEAVVLDRHSLDIKRRLLRPDDLGILVEEAALGLYMMRSGTASAQDVEPVHRQAVAALRSRLGPTNMRTLAATGHLAAVLGRQQRYDEEVALYQQILDDGRKVLGPDHPKMRDIMNNLSAALIDMGDLAKAEATLNELVAIGQRVDGPASGRVSMAKFNLACVQARRGRTDAALTLLEDALHHNLVLEAALEMEGEESFVSLRGHPRFNALIAETKRRQAQQAETAAK